MSDNKKRIQAAWAILLLLYGLWPAVTSAASGSGASSPTSNPASDRSTDPNEYTGPDPAGDGIGDGGPAPWPEADGLGTDVVVDEPTPAPTGEGDYIDDPRQDDPTGSPGGVPVEDPNPLPDGENPMDSPYGNDNNDVPLPDALEGMPDPETWAPWMPSPGELADKLATGAAVQVSILAPTGISYETAVQAGTLVAAGALVAGDGPLPVGDAAAAGLVGPGFLMQHGIDASSVPGISLPDSEDGETEEPDETSEYDADTDPRQIDPEGATGGTSEETTETNDSIDDGGESSYTPDSGGHSPAPDYDDTSSSTDTSSDESEPVPDEYQDVYDNISGGMVY